MIYLFVAIALEVAATTALKSSHSFSRLVPSLVVVAGYAGTLFCFSKALEHMNVGIAYAIWAGVGIVLVTASSAFVFRQSLDAWGVAGIGLILIGVMVLSLLSKSTVQH